MLTWNTIDSASAPGTGGIAFEWPGGGPTALTSAEQGTIDAGDATATANRVNYLRGERSNEINATTGLGLYRARDGVLGDIIDSSPTWVGPPSAPYVLTWKDNLNPGASMPENSGQNYSTFTVAEQSRLNVVYVGANDGFLHGFRSGAEDAAGNVITSATTPNDGLEVLAYMPGAILNTIHPYSATPSTETLDATLDYSNASYVHNYFVDATPGSGDLYYGAAWHTWLVGGLGLGGSAIYALDVTNPSATNFIEGNAASLVKGEWDAASITCVGNATCGNSLGYTYGTPQIRRLHNGNWGAIFGNGFGSSSGDAGIYVMVVDHSSGAVTFYYLSTSTGSAAKPNGIAYVAPADLDGDHITDYVYAGDLLGNVWKFDLTSNNPTNWVVRAAPVFTAAGGQPITTRLIAASVPASTGLPRLMLAFGTGLMTPLTNSSPATYATASQSLYGAV
jgi:type IV pilus assembly protein PilY1